MTPNPELIAQFAAELVAVPDAQIAYDASYLYSALSDWGASEMDAAANIALLNEVDRRGLRAEVAAILDSRQ